MRTAIASAQAGALPVGGPTGRWAVADKPELFASMSAEQVVANFGGRARLRQLQARTQRAALAQQHSHDERYYDTALTVV